MDKDNLDLKKEARILSFVAKCIEDGTIKPKQEQIQMIVDINNQLYRYHKKDDDLER